MGTKIYSISELQPGDLVFFNDPSRNKGKACSHAGIYIGNGQHVHASSSRNGGVITSDLTSGYYNTYFVGGLRRVNPIQNFLFFCPGTVVRGLLPFFGRKREISCKNLAFWKQVCYIHTSVKNMTKEAVPCLEASTS